jgi:hypothetical protein
MAILLGATAAVVLGSLAAIAGEARFAKCASNISPSRLDSGQLGTAVLPLPAKRLFLVRLRY